MVEILEKHLAALSDGNWDAYLADLVDSAVYEEVATGVRVTGAAHYLHAVRRWKRGFPNLTARVLNAFASGDQVVAEVEWTGMHTGPLDTPFGMIAPTNQRVLVQAVLISTIRNGKIVETRHYFDALTLFHRLGVMPTRVSVSSAATASERRPRH